MGKRYRYPLALSLVQLLDELLRVFPRHVLDGKQLQLLIGNAVEQAGPAAVARKPAWVVAHECLPLPLRHGMDGNLEVSRDLDLLALGLAVPPHIERSVRQRHEGHQNVVIALADRVGGNAAFMANADVSARLESFLVEVRQENELHLGVGSQCQTVIRIEQHLGHGSLIGVPGRMQLDRADRFQDHGRGNRPQEVAAHVLDGRQQLRLELGLIGEFARYPLFGLVEDLARGDVAGLNIPLRDPQDADEKVTGLDCPVRLFARLGFAPSRVLGLLRSVVTKVQRYRRARRQRDDHNRHEDRDSLIAPAPAPRPSQRSHRPGRHRLAAEKTSQVGREIGGALITSAQLLLQAAQTDVLEVARNTRRQSPQWRRLLFEHHR